MGKILDRVIMPIVLPIALIGLIIAVLMVIGETFLGVYQGGEKDRIDRPELWVGIGILLAVIAIVGFLYTRPKGALGPLDKHVAVGSSPLWADELPKVDATKIRGELGTVDDIQAGFTVYAQSGAIARVLGLLPGGTDYGKRFSGFMYAEGVGYASKELWIPFEAVTAVYPETQSVFLAIKGDETEAYGWNTPPESITRGASRHKPASERVK